MPKIRSFTVLPALPDSLKGLDVIARNMFWSWNPEIIELFKRIDSDLWSACRHNPVKLLGSVSQQRLDGLAENQGFLSELSRAIDKLQSYLDEPTWFGKVSSNPEDLVIAYFSAEFGLHESLAIYSGGLGVLAGDHLKSASDLGIPLVGVGLLYQKGYFRQYLSIDCWQQDICRKGETVSSGYEYRSQFSTGPYDYRQSLWRRQGAANSPRDYAGYRRTESLEGYGN